MNLPTIVYFNPSRWGELEKFAYFYRSTYSFPNHIIHCVSGTSAHYDRARRLLKIATAMVPSMKDDALELEQKGFSHGKRAAEVSALIESTIISLYSSVDTARKIVTHVYSRFRGLPDSTRRTFQRAAEGAIDERVPQQIRDAFKNASWYPKLRKLRDVLTHVERGSCHLDPASGIVNYYHNALGTGPQVYCIQNIFAELDAFFLDVNQFLGALFSSLNDTLNEKEIWQMCGVFHARIYSRYVGFSRNLDFNSGRCDSYSWFDSTPNLRCPFADTCSAYQNRGKTSAT